MRSYLGAVAALLLLLPFLTGCPSANHATNDADGAADGGGNAPSTELPADMPKFDAANFHNSTKIDNQWFPLKPGTRFIWEGTTVDEEGDVEAHSVSFVVTDLTKEIDGVQTVVCWDRDFVDGELEEAEIVFFAQDNDGNLWHFGQYPEEYSNGEVVASPGWLHSKNGRAGIHIPANPKVGDASFPQGWAPTVPWTDRAVAKTLEKSVSVPTGDYENVLMFDEWNLEEPDAKQQKYYAQGVGNIKVTFSGAEDSQEELLLIKVEQLGEDELAEARAAALKLEASALERCKEVFADMQPSKPAKAASDVAESETTP